MNSEQLQKTRQEHWRQDGNALLTLEDAEQWLKENQLCLFLPRRAHLPVPAPSFAEAVGGKADATPGPEMLAQARQLMARLVASGAAVPLNLFGTPGEHPDFLATPEALMFLYALQGERNPKHGPQSAGAGRVSPLAVEVWKVLEREGALTADELRERVGREITEAAVLRALSELWHALRVVPVPGENDEPAHWEPLSARHRKAITSGSTQSQTTALSMLVSYYLRSAIIGTGEEIELFLSPVTSRSRVRDVLRGLSANRQLGTLPLGTQMHFYVEGTLPEFVEEEMAAIEADAGLEGNEPDMREVGGEPAGRGAAGERAHASRPQRDARPPSPPRRSASERPAFGKREGSRPSFGQRAKRPSFGERSKRPFGAPKFGASKFGAREGSAGERSSRPPFRRAGESGMGSAPRGERSERGGERRGGSFGAPRSEGAGAGRPKRFGGASRSFKPGRFSKPFSKPGGAPFRGREVRGREAGPGRRDAGARPPFRRAGGDRPQRFEAPGAGREGGRPPQRREASGSSGGSFGARKERPARRPFGDTSREGSSFKPRAPRPGADRPSFPPRDARPREARPVTGPGGGARTFKPARAFRPGGRDEGGRPPRREGGDRAPSGRFGDKGGSFKPRAPRGAGDRPPYQPREGRPAVGAGGPRTFKPRGSEGQWAPRREGGFAKNAGGAGSARPPYKSRGARPASGPSPSGPTSRPISRKPSGDFRPRREGTGGRPGGAAGSGGAAGRGSAAGSGGPTRKSFGGPKRAGFKPGGAKSGGRGPGGFKPGGGGFSPPKRKGPRRPDARRPDNGGAA